ncbi:uncharacterized protein PFL1_02603 [Pseudozyma flocculosa PF-1]|uniref:Peptidase C15, pyroglutamyl peptidase I-like protein n=2 Tax=Pseudozyma flocculosa TaxID=84751 RepID=A0A5C3F1B0_9BASI|nr:uncharacterized protein PFL1_02603 [Pseudozyma flocculosa PF-1]EPQ29931.1 hypothetical protein PFL1_02603 [Pseudozyma flocculosa PF-1]SPO37239.1 uncharacterized protein PSFLO_02711 [Pseudozyma flocculosa]
MAPTPAKEIKVLVTGYGPFRSVVNNPSWLAVKPLHNRRLDLSQPPSSPSGLATATPRQSSTSNVGEPQQAQAQAHIQCIQLPVHYGHVLDTLPRLHGASAPYSPDAKLWFDARCDSASGLAGEEGKPYPEGYAIEPPQGQGEAWDVILHVGVGARGGLECESLAHKTGYHLPDAGDCLPPLVDGVAGRAEDVAPQETEKAISSSLSARDGKVRGFGRGYEQFDEVQKTPVDVDGLVAWLKQQGFEDVKPSTDAGLYLCEFILYASLCEAERAAASSGRKKTDVMFLHVPPVGERLDTATCTALIERVAWFCAHKRAL